MTTIEKTIPTELPVTPTPKVTATASTKIAVKPAVKSPVAVKAAVPAVTKAPVKAKKAVAAKVVAKTAAKPVSKPSAKPVAKAKPATKPAAPKPVKVKKLKMVRDSLNIPKLEYAVLEALKLRASKLASPVKKTEVIRAGIKALAAMSDGAFVNAIRAVPSLKTGRPAKAKAA
jgi:hypothetical protein